MSVKANIRINIKLKKEDAKAVINCLTSLPAGVRLVNTAELKTCHRFIFLVPRYQVMNKLFGLIRKNVKNEYSFMPRNKRKLC